MNKDLISKQKKFQINSKGTIGLKKRKPRQVLDLESATNGLEKLNGIWKLAVTRPTYTRLQNAYSRSMINGIGSRKDNYRLDVGESSNVGIVADKILYSRIDELTNDYDSLEGVYDKLTTIEVQMGNYWWENQNNTSGQTEELKEIVKEVDEQIAILKSLTRGF